MNTPAATLDDYRAGHAALLDHYVTLARDLTDDQMAVTSLCPEWNVRDVITHILTVEAVLDGWQPSLDLPPFAEVGSLTRELDALDRDAFAARAGEIVASRLADLDGRDPAVIETPSFTPTGPATYGRFLQVRTFDHWVHARDISRPLGLAAPAPDGFAAHTAVA